MTNANEDTGWVRTAAPGSLIAWVDSTLCYAAIHAGIEDTSVGLKLAHRILTEIGVDGPETQLSHEHAQLIIAATLAEVIHTKGPHRAVIAARPSWPAGRSPRPCQVSAHPPSPTGGCPASRPGRTRCPPAG